MVGLIFLLAACSTAPDGFCDCMKKGEELNRQTQLVLNGNATEATKRKMIQIRNEKKKVCLDFETASGPEMKKWQEACKN